MTTTVEIQVPAVPASKQDAYLALQWCLRTIGEGFHADNGGAEYIRLSTGEFILSLEQAVAFDAMIEGVFANLDDPNGEVLDLIAPCYVCHRPVYLGDEPGEVLVDGDKPVPVCSDACTVTFFEAE